MVLNIYQQIDKDSKVTNQTVLNHAAPISISFYFFHYYWINCNDSLDALREILCIFISFLDRDNHFNHWISLTISTAIFFVYYK